MLRVRSRSASSRATTGLVVMLLGLACRPTPGVGTRLEITAPAEDLDADVYIDGNYVGAIADLSSAGTQGILLAPGVHRLEIRKAGRFPVQRTVRVDETSEVRTIVEAELLEDPL